MAKKKPLFKIDPGSEVVSTGNGYISVTTTPEHPGTRAPEHKKTYVYLHVVIMENHIGRQLKENEEVHHKDEDPTNNKLSNLELRTRAGHARQHSKKNHFWKKSPLNKPKKKKKAMSQRIAAKFIASMIPEKS